MHAYTPDGHSTSGITRKPSFLFFNSVKKQDQYSIRNASYTDAHAFVPSHSTIGTLLGELSFSVHMTPGRGIVKTHSLTANNGRKEIAKIMVQTGLYIEEDFFDREVAIERAPMPQSDVPEFAEFVNLMFATNMVIGKF